MLPKTSDDPIVREYAAGQTPNDYMISALVATTLPGDQVLDIGCHVGTFSIGAAILGRKIIAVDANPLHVDLVKRSFAVNGLESYPVLHRAISTSKEPISFIENGLFGAIDFSGNNSGTLTVETIGLDELVARHAQGRRIRFLKMDIEGAEFQALESAQRLLSEDAPVIWWESNGPTLALAGSSIPQVRTWLEDHGYKTFRIEGEKWVYAPPSQIQPEAWLDVISISEGDQKRWAKHLFWNWEENFVIERCRDWLRFEHRHTLNHLLTELNRLPQNNDVKEIADKARQLFESLPT